MTNNKLKIIAIISMIIDHFGYYFNGYLNESAYISCRIIGRCAMPIFTFLIVEGYLHTSNFKKYIVRIGITAIITQTILKVLDIVAKEKSYMVSNTLNILFAYVVLLIFIKLFENIFKNNNIKNKVILAIYISFMILLYKYVNVDYGIILILLGFIMYLIKNYIKYEYLYNILIATSIIIVSLYFYTKYSIYLFIILSIIPILLYNGNLGKKNKFLKYLFYAILPLQHLILYGVYILF